MSWQNKLSTQAVSSRRSKDAHPCSSQNIVHSGAAAPGKLGTLGWVLGA